MKEEAPMDIVSVTATIAFFGLCLAYETFFGSMLELNLALDALARGQAQ
jgi:hypothetical protein